MGVFVWCITDAVFVAVLLVGLFGWAWWYDRKKRLEDKFGQVCERVWPIQTSHCLPRGKTGRYEIKRKGEPERVHTYDEAICETSFLVLKLRGRVVYSILHTDVEKKTILS